MMDMTLLLLIVVSYLIGSIPSGLILGKQIWNTDLREHGSHNIGATNAFRTLGKNAAFLIFACDAQSLKSPMSHAASAPGSHSRNTQPVSVL